MNALPIAGTSIPAERMAADLIRGALAAGESPNIREVADRTALTVREVDAIRDRLLSGRRDSSGAPGRVTPPKLAAAQPPAAAATPPAGVAPARPGIPPAAGPDDVTAAPAGTSKLIGDALGHPAAAVRRAGRRAQAALVRLDDTLGDLRTALAVEADRDRLRAKEANLVAQLTAIRATIRGRDPIGEKSTCGVCGATFKPTGLKIHAARKHGEAGR